MDIFINLNDYFSNNIKLLNCQEITRAYVINVFSNSKLQDLSKESITLIYNEAKLSYKFEKYQALADWLLFVKSLYPQSLNGASSEYYNTIAQLSYYKCYILINKQWAVFEELADLFPVLVENINNSFNTIHSGK